MSFRAQEPGETNQQYQLRRTLAIFAANYFESRPIQTEDGLVIYVLGVGEGTSEEAFLNFAEKLEELDELVENPPAGFFTIDGNCFTANTASAQSELFANFQYRAWNCEEYFVALNIAAQELTDAVNEVRAEQRAYLSQLDLFGVDDQELDQEVTPAEVLDAVIDQQENVFEQRDEVTDSITDPKIPWWLYAAGAAALVLVVKQ